MGRPVNSPMDTSPAAPHLQTPRRTLAALRLLFLYAILCTGILLTILLIRVAIESGPALTAPQPPADAHAAQIPLGYLARPSQLAGTVLFLGSDHADYITGATINVSGGWLMY